jgi:hypothetical protein
MKYDRLLKCFTKIKEAIEVVVQEVNEIEVDPEAASL